MRPHLDYGNIIYHKYDPDFELHFTKKLESTQYSAVLAATGALHGTNTDGLYEELRWEVLYYKRWYRRVCHFYKLGNDQGLYYLYSEIHKNMSFTTTWVDPLHMNQIKNH